MKKTPSIVEWVKMPQIIESRGRLVEIKWDQLPFIPQRNFFITDVPAGTVRGGHAHGNGKQILFCLSGHIEVELRHNNNHQVVTCTNNGKGLLINEGIWAKQTYLVDNSILLVLCSHPYSENSYQW